MENKENQSDNKEEKLEVVKSLSFSDTPNNDLYLQILNNGATFLNLHDVHNFKTSDNKKKDVITLEFYCGNKLVVITLFKRKGEE